MPARTAAFSHSSHRFTTEIQAPVERVWLGLTGELRDWWPADFYAAQDATGMTLDLRVGGLWVEHWGPEGDGGVWGQILKLRRNALLEIEAETSIEDGPGRNILRFELAAAGAGTRLACTVVAYGPAGSGAMDPDGMEQGWRFLLEDCLKPWLEAGERPERPDGVR